MSLDRIPISFPLQSFQQQCEAQLTATVGMPPCPARPMHASPKQLRAVQGKRLQGSAATQLPTQQRLRRLAREDGRIQEH